MRLVTGLVKDSLPIDKDSRACRNISIQFPCVFVCLSFSDLFNSLKGLVMLTSRGCKTDVIPAGITTKSLARLCIFSPIASVR